MSSCQVCYEAYADEGEHVPYKLKCGDIQCFRCIESELIDGEYYCPECGDAYRGESVTDFAIALMTTDLGLKYTSDEGTSDEEHSSRNSRSNSADSSPRCASNHSSMDRRLSVRTPCKAPDCDKKAISNGYCLKHTKHLSRSVLGLEQLANEMIEHHDLRNFKNSSHNLRKSEQEPSRTSIILDPPALIEKFQAQERIELGEALDLIMRAKAVMSREPNILRLDAPVIVVGDVHGQFFDLVNIMNEAARSTGKSLADQQLGGPMYLFLGDYVDRGQYSCEVMLYLLSLKVAYPERIWLVRGNHECASVSGHFGFKEECKVKYGMNIYYSFLLMFQTMPLGAIISTAFGDIYACHGGLSPGLETIETIETLDRMIEPESNPNLMDILWADPISDENVENMTPDEYNEFINIDWRPNPSRGCSYCYGFRTVKRFLETNNLVCLVRAHEVQEEGYRKHFAPEIMESKIITLQQKMSRAALAKEVAAKARLSLHLHAQKSAAYTAFNTTINVGSADSELGGLHIDVEEDFNPEEALRVLHGATADHENAYEFSEITTPSASGVRNRGFHHATSASDVLHHNIVHNSTAHNQSTHNSSMQSMHSVHSKRSSPYRPASDTSSSAGIQQAEDFPPVITIFSAPNYCDRYHNKGAILLIDSALDGFRVIQYDCVEHPPTEVRESQTKTLIDLVIATCPYMPTSFRNFVRLAVELGQDDVDSVYSGSSSVDGSVVEYTEDNNTEDNLEDDLDNMDIIDDNTDINNAIRGSEEAYEAICEVDGSVIEHTSGSRPASPRGSPVDQSLSLLLPTDSTGAFMTATDASVSADPSAIQDGNNMELASPHKMTRRASKIISLVRQNSLTMSFPSASSHEGTSERLPSPFPYVTEEESVPHNSEPTSARSNKEDREEDELVHCFSENEDLDIHTQHAHMFSLSPILTTDLEPYISNTFLHSNTKENENTMNTDSSKLPRRKSNVYIQALASDAINEAHPVKLNLYLEEFKKTYESSLKKGFQISLFELSSDEKPAISVNDLKKRFENKSFDSFTTNTRPFSQNKEVVHDFERGTGISNIMNMFGGSGRISSSGKFRTSFPLDTSNSTEDLPVQRELRRRSEGGGGKEAEHVMVHSQHKIHNHRHSTGSAQFNLNSLDNDHIITNEGYSSTSVVLNGDNINGAEYKSGFHSEGHTPTKPPLNRSIRDVNQRYSLSSTASDNTSTTGNNNNNTNPNNNNDNGNHHRITSTGSTLSNASLTSDVQHNLDTLDTLSTAATAGAGSMLERTQSDSVLFTQSEIMGLRLMFSLFDRSGENKISYLDLVAYAEETDDGMAIRDAGSALEILDLDGDGCIGILDFIYFARRLKKMHQLAEREENGTNMP